MFTTCFVKIGKTYSMRRAMKYDKAVNIYRVKCDLPTLDMRGSTAH